MADSSCSLDVEACVQHFREKLQEDKEELQSTQKRVQHLLHAVLEEFPNRGMVQLSENSVLNSLFADDPPENFFPLHDGQDHRKRLAEERRAEYNAFLQKEADARSRRAMLAKVTPKSILESVDYEKVLAKRKAEESEFRKLNRAEPHLDKNVLLPMQNPPKYEQENKERSSNQVVPTFNSNTFSPNPVLNTVEEQQWSHTQPHPVQPPAVLSQPIKAEDVMDASLPNNFAQMPLQAIIGFSSGLNRGGGGDPLRDLSGNIITTRGVGSYDSENVFKNKQLSYREELRRQIEEKRAFDEAERRRQSEKDAQIARRSEEQRLRMQREFEEEQLRTQRKAEQRERERVQRLEEFQMRDAADRRKRAPPPEPRVQVSSPQEEGRKSPPVPSVRSRTILESVSAHAIPTEVKPENVFSSLSEIRRTLMQAQLLSKKDQKNSYEVTNRRTVPDVLDDDENT